MQINSVQSTSYRNVPSFGKLFITKNAVQNIVTSNSSFGRASEGNYILWQLDWLKQKLDRTTHWDLHIYTDNENNANLWPGLKNRVMFKNKTGDCKTFFNYIKLCSGLTKKITKSVEIYADSKESGYPYVYDKLKFQKLSDAENARQILKETEWMRNASFIKGIENLVKQIEILENSYIYMEYLKNRRKP